MRRLTTAIVALASVSLAAACSGGAPDPEPTEAPDAKMAEVAPSPTQEEGASNVAEAAEIEGITNKRLSFEPGTTSATVQGSITGYETIDYLLNVREGQALNISMATPNTATYFNVLEPGETVVAVFNGSTSENMFEGVAARSGDYRLRVYMMRSAARRDEKADYRLEVNVN